MRQALLRLPIKKLVDLESEPIAEWRASPAASRFADAVLPDGGLVELQEVKPAYSVERPGLQQTRARCSFPCSPGRGSLVSRFEKQRKIALSLPVRLS